MFCGSISPEDLKDRRHSPLWAECVCVESVFVAHVCGERVCGESVFCGDDADGDATPVTRKQSTHLGRGVIWCVRSPARLANRLPFWTISIHIYIQQLNMWCELLVKFSQFIHVHEVIVVRGCWANCASCWLIWGVMWGIIRAGCG